jgi:uncharacterized protein
MGRCSAKTLALPVTSTCVEFLPDRTPGLLQLAQMELELEAALGRQVEMRTYEDLSPFFRDNVAATARPAYAA